MRSVHRYSSLSPACWLRRCFKLAQYDWTALREAAHASPASFPLAALDRTSVLAQHAALAEREDELDRKKEFRVGKVLVGAGKRSSGAAARSLRILRRGVVEEILRVNERAKGASVLFQAE